LRRPLRGLAGSQNNSKFPFIEPKYFTLGKIVLYIQIREMTQLPHRMEFI